MRFPSILVTFALPFMVLAGLMALQEQASAQTAGDAQPPAETPFTGDDVIRPYVIPESGPFNPEEIEIENNAAIADWFRSAHADTAAEAFRHWDADEEISPACAVCHSGEGFRSFHGLDGSDPGIPDEPVNVGGVVDCETCHNTGLSRISEIVMPSGLSHPVEGVEAACMTCHQGRTAGTTVEAAITNIPVDLPDPEISFVNPHYATAAATWLGGYGGAGYHYDGKTYSGRFFHARPVSTCVSCHQPHTLEIATDTCRSCHENGTPTEIRIARQSYDGSGDTAQGIHADIAANADTLLEMIQRYAADVATVPLIYDGGSYPYFFADENGDGVADTVDGRGVAYGNWTPRMLRTAYNWKLVTSDPGIYAHNPHYALELLYDSVEDLSGPLGVDMDSLGLLR
ncbi:cytochrome C [Roseisalinus antarcticus]|uniref:Uncharacterized protein n=1 Tax=Roseisalinus antarcticus TaxID=254357 RepID=A0A1Y5RV78_9RHOB|nr:cytochrome C [Roseisalinus antarcticus]SLN26297.1 hypothetical protein ROA7023_00816 [Roseisalinus antarcticus]